MVARAVVSTYFQKKIHFLTWNLCFWLRNFWARSLLQLSCYLVWSDRCCGARNKNFAVASQNFPEEFSSLPGTFLGTSQNSSKVIEGSGACPGHLVSMLGGWFALVWLLGCWGACWSAPLSHFGRFGGEGFCSLLTIQGGRVVQQKSSIGYTFVEQLVLLELLN